MGLESATYLDDLVITNPLAGDLVAQGDDHLRLLKSVLKTTFPNLDAPRYLEQARADVASASSPDIWAAATNYVNITGTTTITDFADADFSGQMKLVRFADVLTLTHGADAIVLPNGENITTAAGDHALFVAQGTTQFVCLFYTTADPEKNALIASIEGLTFGEDSYIYGTDVNVAAAGTITEFGRSLIDDADATAARTTLGGITANAVFPGAIVAIIEDQKSQNTSPQSLSTGANTRDLTTLAYNRDTIASLASNRFTLPAGTWEIAWSAPVGANNFSRRHQTYLYNFTDSTEVARGDTGASTSTSDNGMAKGISVGSAVVTIEEPKAFEIRHFTNGSMGGGDSANNGTEVYTRVSVRAA